MNAKLPRGVRNANPGNIDRTKTVWQGEDRSASAVERESRFAVFDSPEYGFRALVKTLLTYQRKHGLRTVRGIINRWAPPVENDTGAYARQVATALGVDVDQRINVEAPATAFQLAKAIAKHENGGNFWGDAVIWDGVELAGIAR
ncbi:structural protein P5 [Xanthomonas phaseoli]|uniref:structural protein P5 n=1 Tax=Xanthomonas phaseoli TaxID=1985254 RepID=UPI0002F083AF|nr:structural protein P5 [Xanthomonas phaseoli]RWU12462.1 structural protein P5 [Xanthomonas phaseoli pv. manihotis str. CIO151]UEQ13634.1 structural protein P5 [Xanthomonas phaseoli pv. manihotis]